MAAAEARTYTTTELLEIARANSAFFDKLVDLIPPRFYLPADDAIERPWYGALSKKQKLEARKQTKENLKKARRIRLDPNSFATTTELLKRKTNAENEDEEVPGPSEAPSKAVDRVKTHAELRERLHKRIEAIRAQRNASIAAAHVKDARDWQKKAKKRKEPASSQDEAAATPNKRKKVTAGKNAASEKNAASVKNAATEKNAVSENEMEFNRVRIDSQKHRIAKKQTKEKLLQQATKLQEEMQDTVKGGAVATKHAWDAAVSRAAGEKVFDNPKLLKQSLRKDQQRREKSAQKWQERQEAEKQRGQEKQQNRAAHIKERIDARKERQIAKREKKLMRPGFEGRKSGFLNG